MMNTKPLKRKTYHKVYSFIDYIIYQMMYTKPLKRKSYKNIYNFIAYAI